MTEGVKPSSSHDLELDQKDMTRLRMLECIREAGAISRTDIATALRTSPATVTATTADLKSAGLIEEFEGEVSGKSTRGRPRVLLRIRGDSHLIAGLKVARETLSVVIHDFRGDEITQYETPLDQAQMPPEALVLAIKDAVSAACAQIDASIGDLSGISISVAGHVDAPANFVHWSSSLVGRNIKLGPVFARLLPCPAFIENDANLVAKAEQLFGEGRGVDNFLVVTIEHGVGLGIVLNGALHRGKRGCGAEFGHTKVQLDGALCQCGQRGCLEAYVGDYALIREVNFAGSGAPPKRLDDILSDAAAGDPIAVAVLERAGQIFGMGLSNLINLFDPERIILSGTQTRFDHLHSEAVMERIRRGVINVDAPLPEIRVHHWGDLMWAKGAAAYGIEQVSILQVKELGYHAA